MLKWPYGSLQGFLSSVAQSRYTKPFQFFVDGLFGAVLCGAAFLCFLLCAGVGCGEQNAGV